MVRKREQEQAVYKWWANHADLIGHIKDIWFNTRDTEITLDPV